MALLKKCVKFDQKGRKNITVGGNSNEKRDFMFAFSNVLIWMW